MHVVYYRQERRGMLPDRPVALHHHASISVVPLPLDAAGTAGEPLPTPVAFGLNLLLAFGQDALQRTLTNTSIRTGTPPHSAIDPLEHSCPEISRTAVLAIA